MPGFAGGPNDLAALTDQDIVRLSNYLIERYGRPGVAAATIALLLLLIFVVLKTRKRGKLSS
jgi:hypothetical protein